MRQSERVKIYRLKLNSAAGCRCGHEARIKIRVMRNDRSVADKFQKASHCLGFARCALDIAVGYAGQLCYLGRDVHAGIDEGVERLLDLVPGVDDGTDLGHAVRARIQAGRFDIEGDHLVIHISVAAAVHGKAAVHVVYEIALASVDYLDTVLFSGLPHIREGLQNAVVCHGNGRMPPIGCTLHDSGRIGERIQRRKAGVHMQLDALFLGIIGAYVFFANGDVLRFKDYILIIAAVGHKAVYYQVVADIYLIYYGLIVLGSEEFYYPYRAREVGNIKAEHCAVALFELAACYLKHVTLNCYPPRVLI